MLRTDVEQDAMTMIHSMRDNSVQVLVINTNVVAGFSYISRWRWVFRLAEVVARAEEDLAVFCNIRVRSALKEFGGGGFDEEPDARKEGMISPETFLRFDSRRRCSSWAVSHCVFASRIALSSSSTRLKVVGRA